MYLVVILLINESVIQVRVKAPVGGRGVGTSTSLLVSLYLPSTLLPLASSLGPGTFSFARLATPLPLPPLPLSLSLSYLDCLSLNVVYLCHIPPSIEIVLSKRIRLLLSTVQLQDN